MHERLADRRNRILTERALAADGELVRRMADVEDLVRQLREAAPSPRFDEIAAFCAIARNAVASSSPFTEEGQQIRARTNEGFAGIGALMSEVSKRLRARAKAS